MGKIFIPPSYKELIFKIINVHKLQQNMINQLKMRKKFEEKLIGYFSINNIQIINRHIKIA